MPSESKTKNMKRMYKKKKKNPSELYTQKELQNVSYGLLLTVNWIIIFQNVNNEFIMSFLLSDMVFTSAQASSWCISPAFLNYFSVTAPNIKAQIKL